jgi:hypothetical protein
MLRRATDARNLAIDGVEHAELIDQRHCRGQGAAGGRGALRCKGGSDGSGKRFTRFE